MGSIAERFTAEMAGYLRDVYVPRLELALRALPEGDLWWRPHAGALSVGSILLHLEGNVRQWILSGLAGEPDRRDRAAEFAAESGPSAGELLARLRDAVERAAAHVAGLDEDALLRGFAIQGYDVSGLDAVAHVVEHFSWHTGQAVWIAKARGGPEHGVAFYDEDAASSARNPAP